MNRNMIVSTQTDILVLVETATIHQSKDSLTTVGWVTTCFGIQSTNVAVSVLSDESIIHRILGDLLVDFCVIFLLLDAPEECDTQRRHNRKQ
jgi:hypothetical protein